MVLVDRIAQTIASLFAKKKVSYNEIDAYTVDIAKELLIETRDDFASLGLELTDFRIEDINFTDKTQSFIDKITDKSADMAAINTTKSVDKEALNNYSEIEKLNIAWKAAEAGWSAWDMMWAWIGMAMWAQMANQMWNTAQAADTSSSSEMEQKLTKLKSLFGKWLLDEDEYKKKKNEIIEKM